MAGPRIAAGGTLILDGAAVAELAAGGARVRGHVEIARERRARVVISAVTLAEVLRGGAAGSPLDEVLARIAVVPVTPEIARLAGAGAAGGAASAERASTVDSIVAATALRLARPVVLLTAVPDVMRGLLASLGEAQPPKAPPVVEGSGAGGGSASCEEIASRTVPESGELAGAAKSAAFAPRRGASEQGSASEEGSVSEEGAANEEVGARQAAPVGAESRAGAGFSASGQGGAGTRRAGRRRVSVARV
ncbi:hypothetical protein OOZ19_17950 [Saccharopolyspora sp. NFXS83]|uniref:type II toxin-antitoxin system VapC family toxin n=1 Tax=Saccharopolyspora sp. NFXS83 TaxID=2993560 RepID=UPI00224AA600|nr:PIN domain-containing protein [Saccharopolyspora sp. NFXS83]MCX2732124.1 hypothetical protein [Saccharopolyspora sp. NFXS83]